MIKIYCLMVYAGLWAVVLTAPAADAGALIGPLLTFAGPDPWSVAVFNLMGVWPVLFAIPLLWDGPDQRLPAWPFVVLSFAAGAFILTPYLLLRRWGRPARSATSAGRGGTVVRWLTHRWVGALAGAAAAGLLAYAAVSGSLVEFGERVLENGFVRTYTADFVAFALLYPIVAVDDRRRTGMQGAAWTTLIPLFGAALHIIRRPSPP